MTLSTQSIRKVCIKCKREKDLDEFHKNSGAKDNLSSYCKKCTDEKNAKHRNSGRQREIAYGISFEKQQELFQKQNGLCAICGVKLDFYKASLDHVKDSDPIQIRGFLCLKHNTALGSFDHNIEILENAIKYLKNSIVVIGDKNCIPKPISNRDTNNPNGYKGINKIKWGWHAQIKFNSKTIHLGTFLYKEQAALAYDNFVKKNLPLGSYLNNIPQDWTPPILNLEF